MNIEKHTELANQIQRFDETYLRPMLLQAKANGEDGEVLLHALMTCVLNIMESNAPDKKQAIAEFEKYTQKLIHEWRNSTIDSVH